MSHVVTVEIIIIDLDALADAARSCGLELVAGQETYRWYGESVGDYTAADAVQHAGIAPDGRCAHALRIPGDAKAYEVGVVAVPGRKGYRLAWDHWNRGYGLSDRISRHPDGKDMELLTQAYALAAIRRAAARNRQHVVERTMADGSVRMTVTV